MTNTKLLFIALLLILSSLRAFAQSDTSMQAMITLENVQITGKKVKTPLVFSTFTNNIFRTSQFRYNNIEPNDSQINNMAVAVQVNNIYNQKIRVDSVFIKGEDLDTSQIKLIFSVYHKGKLYKSSTAQLLSKEGKIYKYIFEDDLSFPSDTSYFSFSFQSKTTSGFKINTNKKINGFLYAYNQKNDFFKLTANELKLDFQISCPQIKLFYTILPTSE